MGICNYCENSARTISNTIGFCADCIRAHFDLVWPEINRRPRRMLLTALPAACASTGAKSLKTEPVFAASAR